LDEEEEEVYDALNDETFGSDAVGKLCFYMVNRKYFVCEILSFCQNIVDLWY
jgi:hypothetical protein